MIRTTTRILVLGLAVALAAPGCDSNSGSDTVDDTGAIDDTGAMDGNGAIDDAPQARGIDGRPDLGAQIDRAGRAAISSALIETFNGDSPAKNAAKDDYNAATPEDWGGFIPHIQGSLAILDSLDATCGNQLLADDYATGGRYATLATILADDQLYVNSGSGYCGVYLGLEAEIVGALGAGEGGCGGRTLSDDVIERSYSVLAAGILAGVDDGVAADDVQHAAEFPFLAEASDN